MAIYIPDHNRHVHLSQQDLRRNTPSLPVLSHSTSSRNPDRLGRMGTGYSPFPQPTPFALPPQHSATPGTPKPLNYTKAIKHSPSLPLRSDSSGSGYRFSSDSFDEHSEADWRFIAEHKQEQQVRKAAAELERRQTLLSGRAPMLPTDIGKVIPPRTASVSKKISWLQRGIASTVKVRNSMELTPPAPAVNSGEMLKKKSKSKNLGTGIDPEGRKHRTRALSESIFPPSETRPEELNRRTSSSSTYGKKIKEKIEHLTARSNSSGSLSIPRSTEKKPDKRWKHRVFSKDRSVKKEPLHSPSLDSIKSERTVIMRRSRSNSSGIESVATVHSDIVAWDSISQQAWQVDGTSHDVAVEQERSLDPLPERALSDSVVGLHNGRMGGQVRKERYFRPWKPPVLELKMEVVSDVQKIPVIVKDGHEAWIAVTVEGSVSGEADFSKTSRLGLDVGVLMDISAYTSADAFEDMKVRAKQLVDAMDTTMDRVAVMTFSAPPFSKRNPVSRGRCNMKVLNSSGSVAKKQLIADIEALQPGLRVDPSTRDVSGAVLAGIRALHQMPLDTNKYGSQRSGHLFLITSKLGPEEVSGDFGGVRVHVIGVGLLFNPTADTGCDGWCVSSSGGFTPTLSTIHAEFGDVVMPTEESDTQVVPRLLDLIRTGIEWGSISDVAILLRPGSGCKIKGILGNTNFGRLLPGERRHLLIKIEAGDLEEWPEESSTEQDGAFDFEDLERQLEATLGELKSTILTVQVDYKHSIVGTEILHSSSLPQVQTSAGLVVSRFVEDSVWSSARSIASNPTSSDDDDHLRRRFMNTYLIRNLAFSTASASAIRTILEKLDYISNISTVMRELQHRQWLENSFGRVQSPGNTDFTSPFNADGHCASSGSDAFEALFYPNTMPGSSTIAAGSGSQLHSTRSMHPTTPSAFQNSSATGRATLSPFSALRSVSEESQYPSLAVHGMGTIRRRTPDEARRLWMKLGRYEDSDEELELEAVAGSVAGSETESEDGVRRGGERLSSTGDTLVTLRNVRETDFPPWVV